MTLKEKLQKLVILDEQQLKNSLYDKLQNYYDKKDIYYLNGGIIVKGKDSSTLVAHLDLHRIIDKEHEDKTIIELNEDEVYCETGIGGDDRCGVLVILQLLSKGYRPSIIFSEQEEIGRVGTNKLINNNLDLLKDVTSTSPYLLGLDRKGFNEVVFYGCNNREFKQYIKRSFGLKEEIGTYNDVSDLEPALNKAICNVSVCYYHPHSEQEIVNLKELSKMMHIIEGMVKDSIETNSSYSY